MTQPLPVLNRAQALLWAADHAALLDATGEHNPFMLAAWTQHFLQQIAEDGWLIGLPTASDGSCLTLYAEPGSPRNWQALANYYSSLWGPVLAPDADLARSSRDIVDSLTCAGAATVQLAPLSAEDPATRALADAFTARRWYLSRYVCFGNWYLRSEGLSFEAFMAQRESRLVNTWKRKAKKLMGAAGAATRVEVITGGPKLEQAIEAYERVYSKSWKKPEPYPRFVGDWARICAQHGWLRLGVAWVDEVPIAAQLWFTVERRAYIFKLAYDEAYASWSAGTVLSAELFRLSLDVDRVVEIDYLTGDDAYKKTWMTERRERVGLLACNPRTVGGLARAAREAAGALRQRWRRPSA